VSYRKAIIVTLIVLLGSGCTTTKQFAAAGFQSPEGDYKLIIMQPDISVGSLTTGGLVEPSEEWTNQARENILKALVSQQAERGGDTKVAMTLEDAGGNIEVLNDLTALHNAVGGAIITHKYYGANLALPTKKGVFDWTLGETAVDYGNESNFDYALFLHVENSFSTGGRQALQVAGWLTCAVGACVSVSSGQQVAFASLVDLKTGRVTWFNTLISGVGDIRTPAGAEAMIGRLLESMQAEANES
jgi:hypothetical protein